MPSTKPPLVLMHGVAMSGRAWEDVTPLLADTFDVHAPTALGHRGGPRAADRPVTLRALVDQAERMLDDLGLDRPHLAGNSLGGWMGIELARRGRASSVCALSPAGFWDAGAPTQSRSVAGLRRQALVVRASRPLAPLGLRSGVVRRRALEGIAEHGDRLGRERVLDGADDLLQCEAFEDLLRTTEQVEQLDILPCPVTLAWSERDRIFPVAVNGAIARVRLPRARWTVLPGVGHVPMIDDPDLVARTIRDTAGL